MMNQRYKPIENRYIKDQWNDSFICDNLKFKEMKTMKNEISYEWIITNPKQMEKISKLLNDEKIENDNNLYEVSMYE